MTSVRPLFFFLLVVSFFASSAYAAGEGFDAQPANGFVPNQTADPALFGQTGPSSSSDLFFLKDTPRLKLTAPAGQPRSAALSDADCFKMRMYKVKRKEHFGDGENGSRGYSTCELASKYQMRTAVAHERTVDGSNSQIIEPEK